MNGLVERSHQTIMCMIGKLGEDKKADWPSHLAEIVHTYNATWSTVTGYSPHCLMFGRWPRLPVNFVFPTVGSNKAPMREASAKHVDVYIASVRDILRTALQEAQAQSTTEVTNQRGWSQVLHWNQLLLVASEIGIPLCMGNCHTWDRCTSPTPCKTTSAGGKKKRMPQEESGKAVTQQPTSEASLGWKNRKLQLLLWTSTRASTEDRWRPQVMWFGYRLWKEYTYVRQREQHLYPLMLADSGPQEECSQSWNWVMVGKAKIKWWGGSEMGK